MSSSNVLNNKSPLPSPSVFSENKELTSNIQAEQASTVKLPASTAKDIDQKATHAIHDLLDVKKDVNEKSTTTPSRSRAGSNASQSNSQGLQSPKQGSGTSTPKSGLNTQAIVSDVDASTKKSAEKLSQSTSQAANKGKEIAGDAADKGKELLDETKSKTNETKKKAKKTVDEAKQKLDEVSGRATETVKEGASDLGEAGKNVANETIESTEEERKELKNNAKSFGSSVLGMGASLASMSGKTFKAMRGQSGKAADGAVKLGKGTAAGVQNAGSAVANAVSGAAARAPELNTNGIELPAKKTGRLASARDMTRSVIAAPFVAVNRGVQNAYANIGVARPYEAHAAWGLLGLTAGAAGYALANASSLSLGIFLTPQLLSLGLATLSAAFLARKYFRRVAYNPSSPEGLGANMSLNSRKVTLLQTEMERLRTMVEGELAAEAAALSKSEAKLVAQNDALKVKTAKIEQQKAVLEQSQKTVANSKVAITQIQVQEESKIANPGTLPDVSPATAVTNPISVDAAVQGNIVETTREQVETRTIGEHVQSSTAPALN